MLVVSFFSIISFTWRETKISTSQVNVQKRKKYSKKFIYKREKPTLAGNELLSFDFFNHWPRLFHLSTENLRAQSVEHRQQSAYSGPT